MSQCIDIFIAVYLLQACQRGDRFSFLDRASINASCPRLLAVSLGSSRGNADPPASYHHGREEVLEEAKESRSYESLRLKVSSSKRAILKRQ